MKRKLFYLLTAMVFLLTACTGTAPTQSAEDSSQNEQQEQSTAFYQFEDSLGNMVTLQEQPKRVAALMGSYAETWLLSGGELVAVTQDAYDERGLELGENTVNVGTNQQPDMEALFAAEPDFVILTADMEGQVNMKDSLAAAGIPAAWFKVESFRDYLWMLDICTDLTGRKDLYEENGASIQETIDETIAAVPEGEKPSVLLLRAYSTGVRAKNSDNIAGQVIADLGAINIADSDAGLLEDLQMESILAADPDFILVTTMGSSEEAALASLEELFNSDPAWQSLTAMKEDRVKVLPKNLFHYKPNAKWGESYTMLFDILYGDNETA